MIKRSSAPAVLTVGLVLGCVAVLAACFQVTVLDESAVASSAAPMLDTDQVETSLRPRVAAALAPVLPAGTTLGGENLDATAEAMVHDPAFEQAFAGALGSVSRHVLDGETGPIVLDPVLVRAAAVSTISRLDPAAAGFTASDPGPAVAVDTDVIPDLDGLAEAVRVAGTAAGVLGLILVLAGILLSERRIRAVARLGRWTAWTGAAVFTSFWLLPQFALPLIGGWTAVAAVVMRAGGALLVPSLVLAAVGLSVNFAANRLIALGREHTLSVVPKAPVRRTTAAERKWRNSA